MLFSPGKSKILAKTKISSGLPNKVTSRSHKSHIILTKLIKKPFIFWARKWPKLSPGPCPKRQHKFSHSLGYYKTIYRKFSIKRRGAQSKLEFFSAALNQGRGVLRAALIQKNNFQTNLFFYPFKKSNVKLYKTSISSSPFSSWSSSWHGSYASSRSDSVT